MKKELRREKENRVIGVTMASVINQWSNSNMTIVQSHLFAAPILLVFHFQRLFSGK